MFENSKKNTCLVTGFIRFGGLVEAGYAERQRCCIDVREAGFLHQAAEIVWSVKIFNACIEITIGMIVAGEQTADKRHKKPQVEQIKAS